MYINVAAVGASHLVNSDFDEFDQRLNGQVGTLIPSECDIT
jgi:hypothetical protein